MKQDLRGILAKNSDKIVAVWMFGTLVLILFLKYFLELTRSLRFAGYLSSISLLTNTLLTLSVYIFFIITNCSNTGKLVLEIFRRKNRFWTRYSKPVLNQHGDYQFLARGDHYKGCRFRPTFQFTVNRGKVTVLLSVLTYVVKSYYVHSSQ